VFGLNLNISANANGTKAYSYNVLKLSGRNVTALWLRVRLMVNTTLPFPRDCVSETW